MLKRMSCPVGALALLTLLCVSAAAQLPAKAHPGTASSKTGPPVGTEEPCISHSCLFYAGDYDDSGPVPNGIFNGYNPLFGGVSGAVYVPFTVPKRYAGAKGKADWKVDGLFVNELLSDDFNLGIIVSTADWSIVQGVAQNGFPVGGKMTTICSGTGTPTVTPTGRTGFGAAEYTILITGIGCPILTAGTYWMTVVPTTLDEPYIMDVQDNSPANAQGPGSEPVDQSFWYSPYFSFYSFQPTAPSACGANAGCDRFSAGVIGTATH